MRRIVAAILVMVTCCLLVSCATNSVQRDLARRFVELTDEGRIPGFPPGSDGEIHMEQSAPYQRVTYPVSRDIFVVRATGTSVYTYNFVKLSKESNWELVKAWMMNQDGERTEIKLDQAGK